MKAFRVLDIVEERIKDGEFLLAIELVKEHFPKERAFVSKFEELEARTNILKNVDDIGTLTVDEKTEQTDKLSRSLLRTVSRFRKKLRQDQELAELGIKDTEQNKTFNPKDELLSINREDQDTAIAGLVKERVENPEIKTTAIPLVLCEEDQHFPKLYIRRLTVEAEYLKLEYRIDKCSMDTLEQDILKSLKFHLRNKSKKSIGIKKDHKTLISFLGSMASQKLLIHTETQSTNPLRVTRKILMHQNFWSQKKIPGKTVLCLLHVNMHPKTSLFSFTNWNKNFPKKVKTAASNVLNDHENKFLPKFERITEFDMEPWENPENFSNQEFKDFLLSNEFDDLRDRHFPEFPLKPFSKDLIRTWNNYISNNQ